MRDGCKIAVGAELRSFLGNRRDEDINEGQDGRKPDEVSEPGDLSWLFYERRCRCGLDVETDCAVIPQLCVTASAPNTSSNACSRRGNPTTTSIQSYGSQ